MAESRSWITPLSGTNYPTWKVQCKMSLMKDGVWQIVTGEERIVREGQDGYLKYATRRDKALATIVLSIDPSLLYLVGDPTDPAVVWEMLSTQFQRKTWANKLALRRRLHSQKLKEGGSISEHIKTLTEIFNELSTLGVDITNEDRVVYLLASLPDSYEMLVTALESNAEVPEMETVIERLMHGERKLKEKEEMGGSSKTKEGALTMERQIRQN